MWNVSEERERLTLIVEFGNIFMQCMKMRLKPYFSFWPLLCKGFYFSIYSVAQ